MGIRVYDANYFKIIGNLLTLNLDGLTALFGQSYSKSYPLSGGALDYTAGPNWAPASYPDSDHGAPTVSGMLGDGVSVPDFWVLGTNNVPATGLSRTTGSRLRVQWNTGILTGIWPGAVDGAVIWIPIPSSIDLTLDVTISSNAPQQGDSNPVRFGVATSEPSQGLPQILADVEWGTDANPAHLNETVTIESASYTVAAINSYVTAGIGTRHYRFELHGPNIAVFGGAVGATTAATLLHGRSNFLRANRGDLHFYLSLGATNGAPYAELGDLSLTGKRAAF